MGINTIGNLAKQMCLKAGLSARKLSNHSARKTAIQTLLHANVNPTDVVQISGHKNIQSLNAYSHLSNKQQKNISTILSTNVSTSNGCFRVAAVANMRNQVALQMPSVSQGIDEPLDDATVRELLSDWVPGSSDLVRGSYRRMLAPNIIVHGNATININYN